MSSRFSLWFFCAAVIALSCGPRARSNETTSTTHQSSTSTSDSGDFATSLDVTVKNGVRFAFHVTNTTDRKIEVLFGSGKTHDFIVLDSAGGQVWRWSAGRMFTQAMQTKLVDPRQTVTYDERWNPEGRTGKFSVIGKITSINYPLEQRVELSLP